MLSDSLGRRLKRDVVVSVADSYEHLEQAVLEPSVDLAWAPPSICAAAEPDAAAIFKVVRFGLSTYNAAFIGRAINPPSLEALSGVRAAWVDRLSAAGYLLPMAHLRREGFDPDTMFVSEEFCGSYQGALLSVLSGRADVTAIYSHGQTEDAARKTLAENVGASESHLMPIGFTTAAPSDGLIATRLIGEDTELLDDLERAVDGSRGSTLLLELFEADRLVRADSNDYAALRRELSA